MSRIQFQVRDRKLLSSEGCVPSVPAECITTVSSSGSPKQFASVPEDKGAWARGLSLRSLRQRASELGQLRPRPKTGRQDLDSTSGRQFQQGDLVHPRELIALMAQALFARNESFFISDWFLSPSGLHLSTMRIASPQDRRCPLKIHAVSIVRLFRRHVVHGPHKLTG